MNLFGAYAQARGQEVHCFAESIEIHLGENSRILRPVKDGSSVKR